MSEIVHVYQRSARNIGWPCHFDITAPRGVCDLYPEPDTRKEFVVEDPRDWTVSNIPTLCEASTNTERIGLHSKGMVHAEGGWPLSVDPSDVDSKLKFTKRVEREESFIVAARKLFLAAAPVMRQNGAVDIYEQYFEGDLEDVLLKRQLSMSRRLLGNGTHSNNTPADSAMMSMADSQKSGPPKDDHASSTAQLGAPLHSTGRRRGSIHGLGGRGVSDKDRPGIATSATNLLVPLTRYADQIRGGSGPLRAVTSLSFGGSGDRTKLAVAYSNVGNEGERAALLWDVHETTEYVAALRCDSQLHSLSFSNKDVHLLSAGLQSGRVGIWDVRQGGKPVQLSSAEHSHSECVTDVRWMMSKTGELITSGFDGKCMMWDVRAMANPVEAETILLSQPKAFGSPSPLRATCLDYDPSVGAHKFIVGTSEGLIMLCNRRGRSMQDKINSTLNAHFGPVYSVQRHPQTPRVFLSVGDWTMKLWTDDAKGEILSSPFQNAYITAARWHPTRGPVFFTARSDGYVDVWDLLLRRDNPIQSCAVAAENTAVYCMESHPTMPVLACGDSLGTVSLWRQTGHLVDDSWKDERAAMQAWFEREMQKDKAVSSWMREAKHRRKSKSLASVSMLDSSAAVGSSVVSRLADVDPLDAERVTVRTNKFLDQVSAAQSDGQQRLARHKAEYESLESNVKESLDNMVF